MDTHQVQVESLFNEAIQYDNDRRAAFLDGACGPAPNLRQKVDTLLKAHDDAEGLLPESPTVAGGEADLERPGSVIDRYKLLQQIGEGGMGAVFMAEQTEPFRRKVALKIISEANIGGNLTTDVLIASAASEFNGTIYSNDRDFDRLQSVRWITL